MRLVHFEEQNFIYAKDQPEYRQLPAHRFMDEEGRIACCWSLSWRERLRVLWTGLIWHQIYTFYKPLQPQLLTIEKPTMAAPPRQGRPVEECSSCGEPGCPDHM